MNSRRIFLAKRAIAAVAFGIVLVQVLPSLADVLTPNPSPTVNATPAPSESPLPSASPSDSASPATTESPAPVPSGSYTYLSATETPTAEPTISAEQDIILRAPSTLPVDPRATSVHYSPINIYSSNDALVCISATGARLSLGNISDAVLIKGNNSKLLLLSGAATDINLVLNSNQGLRIVGESKVQGSSVTTKATNVTRPTLNSDLCAEAEKSVHSRVVALGLGMNTVKNPVQIK